MPTEEPQALENLERGLQNRASLLTDRFAVWVGGFGSSNSQTQHQPQQRQRAAAENPAASKRSLLRQPTPQLPPPLPPPLSPPRPLPSRVVEVSHRVVVGAAAPPGAAADEKRRRQERVTESLSAGSLSPSSCSQDSFESTDGLLLFPAVSSPPREGEAGLDRSLRGGGGGGGGGIGDSRGGVLDLVADAGDFTETERGAEDISSGASAAEEVMAMTEKSADVWMMSRTMRCLSVVAFWASHTCSVYATKALLSRPGRTIRSVVLITWCQCLASFLLVLSLGSLGERQDSKKGAWRSGLLTEMARALPTNALLGGWNSKSLLGGGAEAVGLASVLFCLAVFADNACLGVVNASFFQVARALTLPFVTFMGAVGARALPPRDLLLPCVLCLVGFSLGVHSQTPEAFADGTSMGVMASLLTAAYTRLLARAEPREAWKVTYVTNRNASVILVPVAVYVGMGDPYDLEGERFLLRDGPTILLAVMATLLPAVAGVCTLWQAQARLGSKGLAASSVGRAAFSHLLAFHVFGNSRVLVGEIGCGLVLTGLALYASCRGGAAVAQAGNVAVPGAAREHFLPSASTSSSVESSSVPSPRASAAEGHMAGRTTPRKVKCPILGKGKASSRLKKKLSTSAFDDAGNGGGEGDERSRDDGAESGAIGGAFAQLRGFPGGPGRGTDASTFRSKRFDAGAGSDGHADAALVITEEGGAISASNRLHSRRSSPKHRRGGGGSGGGGGDGFRSRQGNPSVKWGTEAAGD